MNFSNSTTDKTESLKDTAALTKQWETIDWKNAVKQVNRLQIRIAKAAVQNNYNKIKRLQYLLYKCQVNIPHFCAFKTPHFYSISVCL